jgi:DNA repair protein RadC
VDLLLNGKYKKDESQHEKIKNSYLPREKAVDLGIEALSDIELIGLLVRTGTINESFLDIAHRLLAEAGGIAALSRYTLPDLMKVNGINKIKAITILGAIELGKRVMLAQYIRNPELKASAEAVYNYLKISIGWKRQEYVAVVLVDAHNIIIGHRIVGIGSNLSADVSLRDVFREAIQSDATSVFVAHNHPSGNPIPSEFDMAITKQMVAMGCWLGIYLRDHLIITKNSYFSIIGEFKKNENSTKDL